MKRNSRTKIIYSLNKKKPMKKERFTKFFGVSSKRALLLLFCLITAGLAFAFSSEGNPDLKLSEDYAYAISSESSGNSLSVDAKGNATSLSTGGDLYGANNLICNASITSAFACDDGAGNLNLVISFNIVGGTGPYNIGVAYDNTSAGTSVTNIMGVATLTSVDFGTIADLDPAGSVVLTWRYENRHKRLIVK